MKIVLTGGGTAGHVTPNIALIDSLKDEAVEINYIGSSDGPEADLIKKTSIPFYRISCGKLRRYFSWQNFIDPFKTVAGIIQSWLYLGKLKPDVIFSKGGFVAFPVVVAGWLRRVPVLVHESDFTPGLANKLSFPFANKICVTFEDAAKQIKQSKKVVVTGTPIRVSLMNGDKKQGLKLCSFKTRKPVVLVIGGSLGAQVINQVVRESLSILLNDYAIIHICGKGNVNRDIQDSNYCQFEYVHDDLAHLFAAADFVISRAGANALYEILVLKKPGLLIPLSRKASRGDQIDNAKFYTALGVSQMIEEDSLDPTTLIASLNNLKDAKKEIQTKLDQLNVQPANDTIIRLLKDEIDDRQKSIKPIH